MKTEKLTVFSLVCLGFSLKTTRQLIVFPPTSKSIGYLSPGFVCGIVFGDNTCLDFVYIENQA